MPGMNYRVIDGVTKLSTVLRRQAEFKERKVKAQFMQWTQSQHVKTQIWGGLRRRRK